MSAPVDVLAVMDLAWARTSGRDAGDLYAARAAVADLIEAITAYYGDTACEYPDDRLDAAIARVGGAS